MGVGVGGLPKVERLDAEDNGVQKDSPLPGCHFQLSCCRVIFWRFWDSKPSNQRYVPAGTSSMWIIFFMKQGNSQVYVKLCLSAREYNTFIEDVIQAKKYILEVLFQRVYQCYVQCITRHQQVEMQLKEIVWNTNSLSHYILTSIKLPEFLFNNHLNLGGALGRTAVEQLREQLDTLSIGTRRLPFQPVHGRFLQFGIFQKVYLMNMGSPQCFCWEFFQVGELLFKCM